MRLTALCMLVVAAISASAQTASANVTGLRIDNIGIANRVFRMTDNGDLFIDQAGMHMEVTMDVATSSLAGHRLICVLMPESPDGNNFRDRSGDLMSMGAITPASDQASSSVVLPIPYQWVVRDGEKVQSIIFTAMVMDMESEGEPILTHRTIHIDPSQVNVNKNDLPGHMLGQLFGGGGRNSQSSGGGLLGSLFGGPSATTSRDCSACDGLGICPHCDGDGFFNPSLCRKCSRDPGVCRRCRGEGSEEVEVEIHDSLF